jgi:pyruvate/2-oxoglutarate dehydrogenase complex dihydrolipoamide dehydrogenase (E3) component
MVHHYDMTIIGGGSGGLTAARLASALGANVLLLDRQSLGGDCLKYGCVPSKSLIHVARIVHEAENAANTGLMGAHMEVDMARVSNYIQGVISRVSDAERVYTEGVTVKFGDVSFKSPTELTLNGEMISSRKVLIATGSKPKVPNIEGLKGTSYWTNEDVFDLIHLPASLIIVGGGPVGVELSQAFERLGSRVTLIQGPDRILPKEDPEVSAEVANALKSEGIDIITNVRLIGARRNGGKKVVIARQGDTLLSFEADELLIAVGRQPDVQGLNLEAARIKYDNQGIKVDDYLQTTASNVLAIGDVIGGYRFTSVAAYQAGVAVRNALVPIGKKKVDYRVVPWCTFTDPEAARVGLMPDEAKAKYGQVRIVKFPWADIDRAQTEGETSGFIKLVLTGKKDTLVGAHMVGARAGELLGEMALAMQNKLSLNDILSTIHAYPTMNTGIQQAVFEAYLKSSALASNRKIVSALLKFSR